MLAIDAIALVRGVACVISGNLPGHGPADRGDALAQGKALFVTMAFSGGHGAGGAGRCPPDLHDSCGHRRDDTTLFNQVKLGSTGFQACGEARVAGHNEACGNMPPFAGIVTNAQKGK